MAASSLDKKQHQTGEITSVQGQNYYVRNFKFKLGHFIRLFDGYNLYNSMGKICSTFSHLTFSSSNEYASHCRAAEIATQLFNTAIQVAIVQLRAIELNISVFN